MFTTILFVICISEHKGGLIIEDRGTLERVQQVYPEFHFMISIYAV